MNTRPIAYVPPVIKIFLPDNFVESGANLSCIKPDHLEGIETPVALGSIRMLSTAGEGYCIEIKEVVRLDFYLHDVLLSDDLLLVPNLGEEAIMEPRP